MKSYLQAKLESRFTHRGMRAVTPYTPIIAKISTSASTTPHIFTGLVHADISASSFLGLFLSLAASSRLLCKAKMSSLLLVWCHNS